MYIPTFYCGVLTRPEAEEVLYSILGKGRRREGWLRRDVEQRWTRRGVQAGVQAVETGTTPLAREIDVQAETCSSSGEDMDDAAMAGIRTVDYFDCRDAIGAMGCDGSEWL